MTKIYTKTGDKGTTRLVDGSCVEKFNLRVEAYGTVDELNSCLGWVLSEISSQKTASLEGFSKDLQQIQNSLFRVGSLLACADQEIQKKLPPVENHHVEFLEKRIDEMTDQLQPLRDFILPGGAEISSRLHLARTICRRSERRTAEALHQPTSQISLTPTNSEMDSQLLIYLNRLSDYLFVSARWVNHMFQQPDIKWDKSL